MATPNQPKPLTVRIGDIFTEEELRKAAALYKTPHHQGSGTRSFAQRCEETIITPEVLARINAKTGQQNNARYLAYMIEYAIIAAQK